MPTTATIGQASPEAAPMAESLIAQHVGEIEAAEARGLWKGQVIQRLDGHDREMGDLRLLIGSVATQGKENSDAIAKVHTAVEATKAATEATQAIVLQQSQNRWNVRNVVIACTLAAAGFGSVVVSIVSLVLH